MKLFSFLEKIKLDKKKIFTVSIIVLLIIYLDFSFILKAQFNSVKSLRSKITKLEKDIAAFDKDSSRIKILAGKQVQAPERNREAISEGQLPLLLEEIADTANKNNVKIMQINTAKDIKAKDEKKAQPAGLTPRYIILDLACTYHNLGGFINDLENLDTFIALQEIKLGRDAKDYLKENANLVLRTYVKK